MMDEEVDWFFKQIDEMKEEYRNDFCMLWRMPSIVAEEEFNEKVVSFLKELLIREEDITQKYGLR